MASSLVRIASSPRPHSGRTFAARKARIGLTRGKRLTFPRGARRIAMILRTHLRKRDTVACGSVCDKHLGMEA
ncbi:hypothetical protein HPP92_006845 [Vanilla planifolia]|uniref:Uncharacterized protein n=1 Tax=Vanilla planifolia TaxID=51239 RepID=A0A835V927_VANPL|nr:hypothetical protein HPP92_006845 [Vanilla planifolia]